MSNTERPVVRTLWRSTDDGRTWAEVDVLAGSPLTRIKIDPGKDWADGVGNLYSEDPPWIVEVGGPFGPRETA